MTLLTKLKEPTSEVRCIRRVPLAGRLIQVHGTDYPIDLSSLFSSNDHHNYSSGVKSDDFIPSSQYDYDFPFNSNNEIDTVRGKGYGHVAEMEIGKHSLEDIAADIDYMNLTKNGSLFTSLNEIDQEIVKSFTMIGKHYVAKLQMRQVDVQKVQQTAIRKLYEDRKLYKKRMGERRTKLFKNHLLRMQSLSDQTVNSVKEHQEAASDALNKANQCILAMLRPTSASPGKRRMKESSNSTRQCMWRF
ncbi:hypothetical protein BKA69DRAFT_443009 [Paraphysoderma sedebokerense]|nr:hypothetical protein BKA69DRAFT_443009 [Paraphysoderma sedebokerense]